VTELLDKHDDTMDITTHDCIRVMKSAIHLTVTKNLKRLRRLAGSEASYAELYESIMAATSEAADAITEAADKVISDLSTQIEIKELESEFYYNEDEVDVSD